MAKKAIFFLFLFLKALFSYEIRVCVGSGENISVSSDGYYEVNSLKTITRRYKEPISFSVNGGLIKIEGYGTFRAPIIIEPLNSHIVFSKRSYRGKMEINIENKKLLLINLIDIEEYLYGVIKMEIDTKWPFETIKAQAILARTFVYKNLGKHSLSGFDFCNGVHCQVYGGINAEDELARKAVDETKGMLLYYGDSLAFGYYHSTCGGMTGNSAYTWEGGKSIPYLSGIICPYCTKSPHYYWKANLSISDIERKLNIGKIYSIRKYPRSNRAWKIFIKTSRGEYEILASSFRRRFGENLIKSTFFDIEQKNGFVVFRGKGYGHGVGLCQWGAKRMGELGFTCSSILSFYFPGCSIKKVLEE